MNTIYGNPEKMIFDKELYKLLNNSVKKLESYEKELGNSCSRWRNCPR